MRKSCGDHSSLFEIGTLSSLCIFDTYWKVDSLIIFETELTLDKVDKF